MTVQNVKTTQPKAGFSVKDAVVSSVIGGVAVSAAQKIMLPNEIKAAIKNSRLSEDAFLKEAKAAAVETSKNLKNSKIDPEKVVENAKALYPEMVATAKKANKTLVKTFAGVAIGLFAIKTATAAIAKAMMNKNEK